MPIKTSSKFTFDKKFNMYKTQTQKKTPNAYESIRILFIKKRINLKTASRLIFDLTYTHKNSKKYKNTLIELNKLIKEYKDDKLNANKQDENIIDINRSNYQIDTALGTVDKYAFWIHKNEIHDMMKKNPNTIIIHKADFYIDGIKQDKFKYTYYDDLGEEIEAEINLKDRPIKFDFIDTSLNKTEIGNKVDWYVTFNGSNTDWLVRTFYNYCNQRNINWNVKIITKAYTKINDPNQLTYLQRYAFNDTGTCVYDGLLDFFSKYIDTKNKHGVAIYNKLNNNPNKYAKSYTIEEMEKLGQDINCSFTISDLINQGNDININKNSCNRFNISFVNTRYNHLDLLKCVSNIEEITTKKYNEIKKSCSFYIERMGSLLTLNGNYKIKNQYSDLVNEWKDKFNINSCSIEIDSNINKFIGQYDDKVHRFFSQDMVIDNKLYKELDLRKAYMNYNKCNQYAGIPSGAYISCSGEGMTNEIFMKQFNNKLVGYYEVVPSHNNDMLNFLGIKSGKSYVLFTSTIKLLIDKNVKLKYINYVISPSIHCPFSDNFSMYIDGDELVTKEYLEIMKSDKNPKDLVKAYCKVVGTMMIEDKRFTIDIKPDDNDKEFYKTLKNKECIYNVDGIYKIVKEKETPKSLKHMALAIHAYSSTIILEQMLSMDSKDLIGVKVDSIVYRRGAKFSYDTELFKEPSKANIESMLKTTHIVNDLNNIIVKPTTNFGLDDNFEDMISDIKDRVIDDSIDETIESYETTNNEYFKPYFISKKSKDIIKFDASFCGEHIVSNVIFLGGAGGCGKTHSILSSKNFMMNDLLFTSTCWELIQGKVDEFPDITGISLPKLTGEMNGKPVEKFNSSKYKYIVNDELTLQSSKTVKSIINDNYGKFIIMMGDIDYDGMYYQCSIGSNVVNPSKIPCQYIKYTKNYRFEPEFNNKVNDLRNFMNNNRGNKDKLYNYVKTEFSGCFRKKINEIKFNSNNRETIKNFYDGLKIKPIDEYGNKFTDIRYNDDVGISALNPIDKNGKCLYSHHFYKQGAKPQYYIKDTIYKKGLYRGAKLDEEPDNKNYTNSLFRTIHAYQGRQLTKDNKIIILLNSLFDFNLLYTAISRARRLDQIIIFDMIKK